MQVGIWDPEGLPASEGLLVGQHTHASMFSLFVTNKTYIKLLKQVIFFNDFYCVTAAGPCD